MAEEPLLDAQGAPSPADGGAAPFCRVCHADSATGDDPLLSPCLCDGSVRWVHRSCLDEWRVLSNRGGMHCELCGFVYLYEMERPSRLRVLLRSIRQGALAGLPAALVFAYASCEASRDAGLLFAGVALGLTTLLSALARMVRRWQWHLHLLVLMRRLMEHGSGLTRAAWRRDAAVQHFLAAAALAAAAGQEEPLHSSSMPEIEAQVQARAQAQAATFAAARAREEEALEDDGADLGAFACCVGICVGAPMALAVLLRLLLPWLLLNAAGFVREAPQRELAGPVLQGLALLGFAHAARWLLGLLRGLVQQPKMEAVRGPNGIPLVRSLGAAERAALRAAAREQRALAEEGVVSFV